MKAINKEAILNLPYPYNLQSNGTMGGSEIGCTSAKGYNGTFHVFNSDAQYFTSIGATITWYYPKDVNISQLQMISDMSFLITGKVYVSDNGTTWTEVNTYSADNSNPNINLTINGYYKWYRIFFDYISGSKIGFGNIVGTYKDVGTDLIPQTVRKYYKYQTSSWAQPILTWDGLINGSDFAVSASNVSSASYPAYKAFDDNSSTYWGAGILNDANPRDYFIYSSKPLNITNWQYTIGANHYARPEKGSIYGSNDGENWTLITNYSIARVAGVITFDISMNHANYYNYYKWHITNSCSGGTSSGSWNYYFSVYTINLTATQQNVITATSSDYDFYEDVNTYMAVI